MRLDRFAVGQNDASPCASLALLPFELLFSFPFMTFNLSLAEVVEDRHARRSLVGRAASDGDRWKDGLSKIFVVDCTPVELMAGSGKRSLVQQDLLSDVMRNGGSGDGIGSVTIVPDRDTATHSNSFARPRSLA